LPKWRLPRHLGIFYMPQIYDMGPTALLPDILYIGINQSMFDVFMYEHVKDWLVILFMFPRLIFCIGDLYALLLLFKAWKIQKSIVMVKIWVAVCILIVNFYVKSHVCVVYHVYNYTLYYNYVCVLASYVLKSITCHIILHGGEACLLKIREEHRFENWVWGKYLCVRRRQ